MNTDNLKGPGRPVWTDGPEGIYKREFEWQLRLANRNDAHLRFPPQDLESVLVAVTRIKTKDPWDIQLNRADLHVKAGDSYRLVFRVRSAAARTINVGFSKAHDPWDGLGLYMTLETSAEWATHSLDFIATSDDRNARIHFDLGGNVASVELSGVSLYDVSNGRAVETDSVFLGLYPASRWNEPDSATEDRDVVHPRFSVIVPTYQRRDLVLGCVRAFERQQYAGSFEVIVVVDGSKDGSAEALRALDLPFSLVILEQPNRGAAAARNLGAAAATGEILLFIDDDMEAHPRLLTEHERSFANGADVVLGTFPLHPRSPKGFLSAAVKAWVQERAKKLSQPGYELPYDELLSGQIALKRVTFQKMLGFDTDLTARGEYGNEDMEFGYRLIANGYKACFNPYAITYQNYVVTPRQRLSQARQTGHASVAFARKHPEHMAVIFAPDAGRSTSVTLWRWFAMLRPLSTPIAAILRALALALVDHGFEGPKVVRFFYQIFQMEFRMGIQQAGGVPRVPSVRILVYHAIRDLSGEPVVEPYGTPPSEFVAQLKLLKRMGFNFISAEQFLGFLLHDKQLPRRPVLLTFDDCYDDLLQTALPILKRFDATGAAFAVSGRIGETNTWDVEYQAPILPLLDAAGLKRLQESGIDVGGHSRSHRALTEASVQELGDEINGCLQELEERGLGRPRLWAYPYGESNARVRRAVCAAGIKAAFTIEGGRALKGCDPFRIPRIQILRGDTGWKFLWKLISSA